MDAWNIAVVNLLLIFALKITAMILGYLTVKLGYRLIADGIKGEFKFSTQFSGFRADLASISPGVFFVLLGIGLIAYGIYVDKVIDLSVEPAPAIPPPPDVPIPGVDSVPGGPTSE